MRNNKQVRVRIPATTANCGPGFDTLGIACTLYNEVVQELAGPAGQVEIRLSRVTPDQAERVWGICAGRHGLSTPSAPPAHQPLEFKDWLSADTRLFERSVPCFDGRPPRDMFGGRTGYLT